MPNIHLLIQKNEYGNEKPRAPALNLLSWDLLHESVAKEKSAETLLIEAGNEANNELLASFPTKSSEISAIFTRHPARAKVSSYIKRRLHQPLIGC